MLELVVDVFLAAGNLLQCSRDFVIELVQLTLGVLQIRVDVVIVLMHLIHVHAPVLNTTFIKEMY